MCGIHGFNFEDRGLALKMVAKTAHRGPDDSGVAVDVGWSLGHNRLSIIDLSARGHQPMKSASGRFEIVFNGEIYNFKEIRNELEAKRVKFTSETDTEVILEAYELWGSGCLQKFNGMFAFAILNKESGELFLARDQAGIKPLYYFLEGQRFIFSSEIKAILEHNVPRILNKEMLSVYFRMLYVPAPYTMFENIFKLEPGHFAVFKDGNLVKTRYWQYKDAPLIENKKEAKQTTKKLLENAVVLQLVADRPVGIFLSGGIDSTIIAGIAAKKSPKISTFSVAFEKTEEEEKYNNDAMIAKRTAKLLGADHHELVLKAEDVIGNIKKSIYHMDEPISNHVQAVNMLLAEFAAKKAIVFLGGDGGDELFGGYERYYYNNLIDRFQNYPSILQKTAIGIFKLLGKKGLVRKLQSKKGVDRYLEFFAQKDELVESFLKNDDNKITPRIFLKFFENPGSEFTSDFMRADVLSWLPNESLARSDKMSMAAGIEYRVPFLDIGLIEYADTIPTKWKLGTKGMNLWNIGRKYEGKKILREAMLEYLPDFVLKQPKWGWFSPASKWIRGPLKQFMKETLSKNYNKGTAEMFDFDEINKIFENHITKKKYALNTLWSIMTFQLWYKTFIEEQ